MTPRPTVEPTRLGHAVLAFFAGFAVTWLLLTTLQGQGYSVPLVGPLAWVSVGALALWVLWLAVRTRREIHRRPDTLEPRVALNRVVWGKTSILAGAALAGMYAGIIVVMIPAWPAPLAQSRVVHSGIALALSLAWAVSGWLLERACRVPPDDTPDTPTGDRHVDS